jgi:hypothetical protein
MTCILKTERLTEENNAHNTNGEILGKPKMRWLEKSTQASSLTLLK